VNLSRKGCKCIIIRMSSDNFSFHLMLYTIINTIIMVFNELIRHSGEKPIVKF
jgi:hypothetical protein